MNRQNLNPKSVEAALARQGQVAIIWSIDDVLEVRPDLSRQQAWQVLLAVKEDHDAGIGINWDTLVYAAEALYGESRLEAAG